MKNIKRTWIWAPMVIIMAVAPASAQSQKELSDAELALKLANPISSMISVPFDFGYNTGYGTEDGDQFVLSLQPVIPIDLSENLSLVIRTIVPIISQDNIEGNSGSQFGLGDTLQSFFFVPSVRETKLGMLTYGVGPAVLWPTSTDALLGSGTLGLGPTGVLLFQNKGWTYGLLANHIWGTIDTRSDAPNIDSTFLQPFLVYTTQNSWTYVLQSEATYGWRAEEWAVPINVFIAKLVTIGDQKVQVQFGPRYWVKESENGAEGLGASLKITFLFPK